MRSPRLLVLCSLVALLMGGCQNLRPRSDDGATNVGLDTASEGPSFEDESDRLNHWFDARYEERLARSPLSLTRLGRKDRYGEIDDFSEAAADAEFEWLAGTVEELQSSFDYSRLSEDAKISYDIWNYRYEAAKARLPFRRHTYLFNQLNGAHTRLPTVLVSQHRVDSDSDMRAYAARIGGIGVAIDQLRERARRAAEDGIRPPRYAYEAVIAESTKLLSGRPFNEDAREDSPLWADANRKIDALENEGKIDGVVAAALRDATRQQLLTAFGPAYRRLIVWAKTEWNRVDSVARGAGSLPNGNAYYDTKLANVTTTRLSAKEIHEIGLREVARIRSEMEDVTRRTGYLGSLEEFFTFIRTDDQFIYPNDDSGRQAYIDDSTAHLEFIEDRLPRFFGLLPKAGLLVKRVERFREQDGAPQHYQSGTPDGSRPGIYYAHLSDMNSMPKSELEAVAYHEGLPGHHMQISIAQERTGLPRFRTRANFTSYVEGWGLYAESLAKEMGAYQDPYSDFGRLLTEMWRAIRLVVDTGIHSKGWSEERSVRYFRDNSAISDGQILAEVRRYFIWPGQATAYKIGMLKIQELRARAEERLGDRFDMRGFHDAVLGGGAVPLSILELIVDDWIGQVEGVAGD